MPPERTNCESCGRTELTCPDCGESSISVDCHNTGDYPPGERSLSPDFEEFALFAEEDEALKYSVVCWKCGWKEERTLSVEIA